MRTTPKQVVLFHHFRLFLKEAASHNIDVAPLKGAYYLEKIYTPDEDRGPLADIDFLVRPRDWQATLDILGRLGFIPEHQTNRPVTAQEFHEKKCYLNIGSEKRLYFEPHRYLVQPKRHAIDYDALWQRSILSSFDGIPCRQLTPEDHLLHAIIHVSCHGFIPMDRFFKDAALLLKRTPISLDRVVERSRAWECKNAAWLALSLLSEVSPDLVLGDHIAKLTPSRFKQKALQILVPNTNGFIFPNLGLRPQEALLLPLVLDNFLVLARFGSYYAKLRAKDAIMRFKNQPPIRTANTSEKI